MSAMRRLAIGCVVVAAVAVGASAATAAPLAYQSVVRHDVATSTSSNWAGYAVSAATGATPVSFTTVSGTWKQPAVTCAAGSSSYSAFWVGLGGFSEDSQALEQIGTEANCTRAGNANYAVWYELVPAASVPIKLTIKPGDRFAGSVTVKGHTVTLRITNVTRKKTVTKTLSMSAPDVSSAEWIAEAPSSCTSDGNRCETLPLANFGMVTFSSAKAIAAAHPGTISDPAWSATVVFLAGGGSGGPFARFATAASATPTALSGDGSAFAVTWSEATPAAPAGRAQPTA
jgi:hypothetical protein